MEPVIRITIKGLLATNKGTSVKKTTEMVASAEVATGMVLRSEPSTKLTAVRLNKSRSLMKATPRFKATVSGTSRAEVANHVAGSEITKMMIETERKVRGLYKARRMGRSNISAITKTQTRKIRHRTVNAPKKDHTSQEGDSAPIEAASSMVNSRIVRVRLESSNLGSASSDPPTRGNQSPRTARRKVPRWFIRRKRRQKSPSQSPTKPSRC